MLRFAVLIAPLMLAMVPVGGDAWAFAALFFLTVFTFLFDETLAVNRDREPLASPPARALAGSVPVLVALMHFALLPLAVITLAAPGQGGTGFLVSFFAFAFFFGTIGTATAHELIHRPDRLRRGLGRWMLITLLFGHHASAHPGVHHPQVATPRDPNTARRGESFWRFFGRAWKGSFEAGRDLERWRRRGLPRRRARLENPYLGYVSGGLLTLAGALALGGARGVCVLALLALFAQAQLLLSDYVQHYGLTRRLNRDGSFEPATIRHSWNAPQVFSSALLMNASHHSDHHVAPATPYYDLRPRAAEGAPLLPFSIPVMSLIALFPRLWRRVMDPRVARWYEMDGRAAPAPDRDGGQTAAGRDRNETAQAQT